MKRRHTRPAAPRPPPCSSCGGGRRDAHPTGLCCACRKRVGLGYRCLGGCGGLTYHSAAYCKKCQPTQARRPLRGCSLPPDDIKDRIERLAALAFLGLPLFARRPRF